MKELDRIVELITGNIAEDKKKEILEHVNGDDKLQKTFNSVKNAWALSSFNREMSELKTERAYLSLQAKIRNDNKSLFKLDFHSLLRYAAILLIVFGAGLFANKIISEVGTSQIANSSLTEFTAPLGQLAEIHLPDGTHVWLNSGSKLLFSANYNDKSRQVALDGEAYFEVQKDKKPFVVSTRHGEVEVLGTSFNVQAFENGEFQTTLVEGSVRYKNKDQNRELVLSAGQQVNLKDNLIIEVREVEAYTYTSWTEGVIIFEKEPLVNVLKKLERHFAVQIRLEDNLLGDIKFTGKIENESLLEVMEYIAKIQPIEYSYDKELNILAIKEKSTNKVKSQK